ncbi:MAG: multi-sensor signal transduction histidine kinase [Myxococcales bacterium]|nr:multi-sensor signal transduction histidine kinase [Myxococcales bacterium]
MLVAAKRIQQRLLVAFLGVVVAVLVPAAAMLDRWMGDSVRDVERDSLTREARSLAAELAHAHPDDVAAWVAQLDAAVRVTVIARDGRVLGDTDVPVVALASLENHAGRPEVVQALAGQIGVSQRRSTTVSRPLLYVAAPVPSAGPPERVLRLAMSLDQVRATVGRAHFAVWSAGLMALTLALLLGATLSRWLTRPILAMTRAARAMTRGDFEASLPPPGDDELGELVHALDTLRNQLSMRLAELRQEGVKLRAIINGMSEGVALVQDGTITVANPAFARLLGLTGDLEGRGFRDATRLPSVGEAIDGALDDGTAATREVQLAGRTLLVQIEPLGGARQAVVVLLDMTEPKRLERLRREFVANASHELRTPVAAIVGVAETLAAGAADDPEARQSFLEILVRHAQRLSRLTADLLDIARLEGGYKPRVEVVDVARSVEAVLATLQVKAAEKQITLAKSSMPPELRASAERAAVEQILTNLVENAIKYTTAGGHVTVSAELRNDKVRLTVADSGAGIPKEHHARLFERFYRVDDARSRDLGGTGLGLAIVKHLALANGGDVSVESDVGKGSRFIVALPRSSGTLPS